LGSAWERNLPSLLVRPNLILAAMNDLTLIRELPHRHKADENFRRLVLRADRVTLAKRRWRGVAGDGREFGFDLVTPLNHDDCFFTDGETRYLIEQQPEAVLEIPIATPEEAARIAWKIGNLHFGIQVFPASLRVVDDLAIAQMLAREGIAFQRRTEVFLPLSSGGGHHHHHHEHE
jgi:urease accessory protein